MPDRDARRWTRLRPESLSDARVLLAPGAHARSCRLVDLSPGGIAIQLPPSPEPPPKAGERVRLQIHFKGCRKVEVVGVVLHARQIIAKTWRLGLAWVQTPPDWNGTDRREFHRLVTAPSPGFAARIPVPHIHGLWTRLGILDLSPDRGLRVEGRGGPIWLLPGMEVDLHLDLPVVREQPLRCQVLWVRPDAETKVQAGLRILDLETPALQALDEWIAMAQVWSPRELVSRGFPSPALPGQYRFRITGTQREQSDVLEWLRARSRGSTRIGFETLPLLPEAVPNHTLVGCWDGSRRVAAIALDLAPENREGEPTEIVLDAAAFDPDWFDREIVRGLWEQAVRLFLSSGRERFRLWCPPDRQSLFARIGLVPCPTPAPLPDPSGCWVAITRETILTGKGMPPSAWFWAYGDIGRFHARQGRFRLPRRRNIERMVRLAVHVLLADLVLPRFKRRLARDMERWRMDSVG